MGQVKYTPPCGRILYRVFIAVKNSPPAPTITTRRTSDSYCELIKRPKQHAKHRNTTCRNVTANYKTTHRSRDSGCYSDQWHSCNKVGALPGMTHGTVNHSLFLVHPVTGAHTQKVESIWNRVKVKLKRMKGVEKVMLPGNLDELMWWKHAGNSKFEAVLDEKARQYVV